MKETWWKPIVLEVEYGTSNSISCEFSNGKGTCFNPRQLRVMQMLWEVVGDGGKHACFEKGLSTMRDTTKEWSFNLELG